MTDLYIGGGRRAQKKNGIMWKLLLFFFLFFILLAAALKVSAPFMVEQWLNKHGTGDFGYAYSVREVELFTKKGEINLLDVKVFNPQTKVELVKSPRLKLKMDLADIFRASDRKILISGDQLDIFLSADLSAEIKRIKKNNESPYLYFSLIKAQFSKLNIIEKKTLESRTLVQFTDVGLDLKELSVVSVNRKTEFTLNAKLMSGGALNLAGVINEKEGLDFWKIEGSLKDFSPELLNKLAGTELPFTFNESVLNAQINARSHQGKLKGEITPEVTRLNLIDDKPGFARQVIARALTEELTFSLPFTLKDELTLEYADTYKKLKEYRKYTVARK